MAEKPDYLGHRQRLRERLLAGGPEPLPDYELLEIVLQTASARGDTKSTAKALLKRFGGIPGVLGASRDALKEVDEVGDAAVTALLAVRELAVRMARAQVVNRAVIASWQQLLDYLNVAAGHREIEAFRILFLDRKNALLADEEQGEGTVDHVPVYPREVVRRVLALGASAVILVHNHPSGDTTPSKGDVEMTRAVAKALSSVGVELHDHVVIGRGRHSSFKSLGLL
jgi:DNA repair protein RadC